MKRLTIRNSDGSVSQPTDTTVEAVFYRLATYEDTGLTPQEIIALIGPNAPLTLEELREMDGQPVWVESPGVDRETSGRWVIVDCVSLPGNTLYTTDDYPCYDYGRVWLAYRRRPEVIADSVYFGGSRRSDDDGDLPFCGRVCNG